jgi:hypothetical protein
VRTRRIPTITPAFDLDAKTQALVTRKHVITAVMSGHTLCPGRGCAVDKPTPRIQESTATIPRWTSPFKVACSDALACSVRLSWRQDNREGELRLSG